RPRPLDAMAMLVSIVVVALSMQAVPQGDATLVSVRSEAGDYLYPIDSDRVFVVSGPLGETEVEIRDRLVRVASDPGPLQICVLQGWIESPGQWLACLPNQVFVQITGEPDDGPDAVAF
ncbi:MAG: NusG domain II-containing protein, partial [Spirochaetota bacterium]